MPIWEYKVITSGKGGFATPALLEKYLNDLGREEWEIIEFRNQPDNALAFTGLARRSTQRDWTLEDAAAAAAKAEADKLRAEFEAKFKAGTGNAPAAADESSSFIEEKLATDDGFRKPIDTSHDADAEEDEKDDDDWDKLTAAEEDELPTFFDAIKPHMRRNQRGPGMSVGVDYLAKKWGQSEDDLKGALVECGFAVPDDEDAKPEYLEFEGDLYWVNINRRGELWINTKEKPRPVFRAVKGQKVAVEEEAKPEGGRKDGRHRKGDEGHKQAEAAAPAAEGAPAGAEDAAEAATAEAGAAGETAGQPAETAAASSAVPEGPGLLKKIRPHMRRNRRGPGGSGSVSFLSRALKCRDADLVNAFKTLGLVVPGSSNEKPTNVEIGNEVWWINLDSRGGIWINGRDKKPGETVNAPGTEPAAAGADNAATGEGTTSPETAPTTSADSAPVPTGSEAAAPAMDAVPAPAVVPTAASEAAAAAAPVAVVGGESLFALTRPLLKESRSGTAAKLERLAESLGKSPESLVEQLVGAGLAVPEKPREKPVFAEHAGELFWLSRNARGELWLNAKPSKSAGKEDEENAATGGEPTGSTASPFPAESNAPESESVAVSASTADGAESVPSGSEATPEGTEPAGTTEGESTEKKPRRPRSRKKAE
ncbi:MAG TPA: hypothetical protein VHE61_08140 [Opitutaceae bacterium]|nr:hypothetical protein [Opitutaceae bacterium]